MHFGRFGWLNGFDLSPTVTFIAAHPREVWEESRVQFVAGFHLGPPLQRPYSDSEVVIRSRILELGWIESHEKFVGLLFFKQFVELFCGSTCACRKHQVHIQFVPQLLQFCEILCDSEDSLGREV